MEISGHLFKAYKERLTPYVNTEIGQVFLVTLNKYKEKNYDEVLDAVCFMCDYIEYGGKEAFQLAYDKLSTIFLELAQKYLKTEERGMIQSVGFGLGVIAQRASYEEFKPFLAETCKVLRLINFLDFEVGN
jgi:hypothetical protein